MGVPKVKILHENDRRRMSFTSLLKGGTHSWSRLICSRVIWAPLVHQSSERGPQIMLLLERLLWLFYGLDTILGIIGHLVQ